MYYLVTGGCGFIGSHLSEYLIAGGHRVTIVDDFSTGKRENAPTSAKLITADITTPGVFDELAQQVDGCFHLAAVVSVQRSVDDWRRTHQVNLGGTVALFDAIARTKRQVPVVFASSAAVYGDNTEMPLKETAHCQPLSAYGADKLACELHAFVASHIHAIPTVGLRFFNVYGPRQDPVSPYSGVISIFAHRMKQHQPITIFGDGEQSRDFIYVGDVVKGLTASMLKLESEAFAHGIFNLCTGEQITINQLAKTIAKLCTSRSAIHHAEARAGDIRISLGSTTAYERALGFRASTSLMDGLTQTLGALP